MIDPTAPAFSKLSRAAQSDIRALIAENKKLMAENAALRATVKRVTTEAQKIEDQGGYTLSVCWESQPPEFVLDAMIDAAHGSEPEGNQVCCIAGPNADMVGVRWVLAALAGDDA
jgi:hypothetical protein